MYYLHMWRDFKTLQVQTPAKWMKRIRMSATNGWCLDICDWRRTVTEKAREGAEMSSVKYTILVIFLKSCVQAQQLVLAIFIRRAQTSINVDELPILIMCLRILHLPPVCSRQKDDRVESFWWSCFHLWQRH